MSRFLRNALIGGLIVGFVASCGGGSSKAPRNLDNACSIIKQRPKIHRAMKKTQRKWGVPVHVQMAVIHQESKFIPDARTPVKYVLGVLPMGRASSAYGYAQALDATWKEYQRAEGGRGAERTDIRDATDFMGWYMTETREVTGLPLSDARGQYLAYHEGRTGYLRGSYRNKSWLMRVAGDVEQRSYRYRVQLQNCR
ncbi:transglycosylase SLT domain-containing protein [Aliiroseovarius sp. KMU-50]|uniref:Transglycosylase SLT domain-containing protein n=1 Tax=Aliiroseovarius salicola TaxID=3009082 RepID=A0ABT4VX96_9RHOB|nr:transglycosylase SLT domain-containing protein [Aliiroseovarius sp. KMU-50]MDA5092878.1 transglycosylase SLT domain-containing protein [Aliiroseovarius sp. KMU-50]